MPQITLNMNDEANKTISELAEKKGMTKAEILRRGLALLVAAEKAKQRGLKIGAAEKETTLVQEWVNI